MSGLRTEGDAFAVWWTQYRRWQPQAAIWWRRGRKTKARAANAARADTNPRCQAACSIARCRSSGRWVSVFGIFGLHLSRDSLCSLRMAAEPPAAGGARISTMLSKMTLWRICKPVGNLSAGSVPCPAGAVGSSTARGARKGRHCGMSLPLFERVAGCPRLSLEKLRWDRDVALFVRTALIAIANQEPKAHV